MKFKLSSIRVANRFEIQSCDLECGVAKDIINVMLQPLVKTFVFSDYIVVPRHYKFG